MPAPKPPSADTRWRVLLAFSVALLLLALGSVPEIGSTVWLRGRLLHECVETNSRALAGERDRVLNASVLFAGIAHEVAGNLPAVIASVEAIGSHLADYAVVVYENDSEDNTVSQLRAWSRRNPRVHVVSERLNMVSAVECERSPSCGKSRTAQLAVYRNKLLDLALDSHFAAFPFVAMIDLDMKCGWFADAVLDSLERADWDVVCANGVAGPERYHYDRFAFRNDRFPSGPNEVGKRQYYSQTIHEMAEALVFRPSDSWVPVLSCFGSLAIYHRAAFLASGCRYGAVRDDCEHVFLHSCLRDHGFSRMFVNPALWAEY